MTCYPVYIPTLNRYEHFRNCVESLANGCGENREDAEMILHFSTLCQSVEKCSRVLTSAIEF